MRGAFGQRRELARKGKLMRWKYLTLSQSDAVILPYCGIFTTPHTAHPPIAKANALTGTGMHPPETAMRRTFNLGVLSILTSAWPSLGSAFVASLRTKDLSVESRSTHVLQRHDGQHKNQVGAETSTTAAKSSSARTAKESFLQNLEQKRAGEDAPSSALDADLSRLRSPPADDLSHGDLVPNTAVANLESWRGRWRICHAPHIDTLGNLLLTSFPIVEYDFQSNDGRMVSHSRYESVLFGSGWLSADGRVATLKHKSSAIDSNNTGRRQKEETVKVKFSTGGCAAS